MANFVVEGGRPLKGKIRVGGAKNAGFKLMIGAVLANSPSQLKNISALGDVLITEKTLTKLGIKVRRLAEHELSIYPNGLKSAKVPHFSGEKTRASTLYAALLLAKLGKAVIPFPGGCVLGPRPIDRHIEALKSLGASVKYRYNCIYFECKNLHGGSFHFPKKTHTGTETMILAAVTAKGRSIIENAGQEPEIDDLIQFLNQMGAKIYRSSKQRIIIEGKKNLHGATHKVMPDRNEVVSYATAALATKGDIFVEDAQKEHLKSFLVNLREIGANYSPRKDGIRFWYTRPLSAVDLKTGPAPGFMTDWQPLWTLLMTQARGVSHVIEAVHNNRFQFVKQLNKMGAKVTLYKPKCQNPQTFYEFDYTKDDPGFHAAKITGPKPLIATGLEVNDLRAGATLTIAALIAQGRSIIKGIEHIDRGYESLDKKLQQLGAKIKRKI